ncbi:MAG TPA: histidine kinase N-terminal 7TM domain-containing protein [Candidatus Paceibacterota bacterium]
MIVFFKFIFFFSGITTLIFAMFLYFRNRNDIINKTYSGLSLCCAVWSLGFFALLSADNIKDAYLSRTIMDIGAIILPAFWIHFVYSVLELNDKKKKEIIYYYFFGALLVALNVIDYFYHGVFTKGIVSNYIFNYYPSAGPGYYLFVLFYIIIVPYSLYQLIRSYNKSSGFKAKQIKFFIIGSLLGFGGGVTAFLFTFNIPVPPYGIILFAFYPVIIAYGITKHHLFDVKVIATELLTFAIWIFVFTRLLVAETVQEQVINGALLIFLIISGILLIKSVIKEVNQREKIEHLAGQLEDFIHFLSHEVKGILGKNRVMFEAMIEGDLGAMTPQMDNPVKQSLKDTESAVNMVMNILQSSDIKNGKLVMNKQPFDFRQSVIDVVNEFRPDVEKKGLQLEMDLDGYTKCIVVGDKENLVKHVIKNLLSNSLLYTPSGKIIVGLKPGKDKNVRFFVKDTGLGLSEHTKAKLFTEGGKGEDASKVNVHSTGYGLYFAKGIVEAHEGKIWAESEGEGKGSTFYVELKCV